jgi:hypothetical protein
MSFWSLVWCCVATAVVTSAVPDAPIRKLSYQGNSHFDFGFAMGSNMKDLIAARFTQSSDLKALKA